MVDQSSIRFFRSIRAMHTIYTKNPPPRHVNVHGALIGYSLIRSRNAPTATTLEINGEASPANIGNGLHPVVLAGITSMATQNTNVTATMALLSLPVQSRDREIRRGRAPELRPTMDRELNIKRPYASRIVRIAGDLR